MKQINYFKLVLACLFLTTSIHAGYAYDCPNNLNKNFDLKTLFACPVLSKKLCLEVCGKRYDSTDIRMAFQLKDGEQAVICIDNSLEKVKNGTDFEEDRNKHNCYSDNGINSTKWCIKYNYVYNEINLGAYLQCVARLDETSFEKIILSEKIIPTTAPTTTTNEVKPVEVKPVVEQLPLTDPPLVEAALKSDANQMEKLLADPSIDPNAKGKEGETALMIAAKNNNVKIIKLLLADKRTDPFIKNKAGVTAYKLAYYADKYEAIKILGEVEDKKTQEERLKKARESDPEFAKNMDATDKTFAELTAQSNKLRKVSMIALIKMIAGLVSLIMLIITMDGMGKTYAKAGKPTWSVIVPVYNLIVSLQVAGMSLWLVILMLLPSAIPSTLLTLIPVNPVATSLAIKIAAFVIPYIFIQFLTAKKFNKGFMFGLGLLILPFIFYPILGFGNSKYTNTDFAGR